MPKKLERMAKHLGVVLGERKKLERVERKLVGTLNTALRKIGYSVVPAKAAKPGTRRRRRTRRAKPAGRPRRRTAPRRRARTATRRRRARAKRR
ncbi:MAG: hypothetical protein ACE5MG_05260 [Candidatus Methylomirabilales bacterium]